jgi:ribonuclease HII
MRILGLDEAGRGSVLGPLVVGAFLYEGEDQGPLRAAGADDSKALSHRRRVAAREALGELGVGDVIAIPATAIDEGNVNTLEVDAFVALVARHRPDRVYLDAPVAPRGIPKFRAMLIARTGVADWIVENKADSTYPVVGAASIWAKTTRDAAIEAIGGIGSGYPSDPATRAVLTQLIRSGAPLPDWVRKRWSTIDTLRQQSLFGGVG